MAEITKAFVIGGFSEDYKFIESFTREICEGPNRIVEDAEAVTLAQAYKFRDAINKEAVNRIVFPHSAGNETIDQAGVVVALNPVEPTALPRTVWRAVKVGTNGKIGREEHVPKPSVTSGFKEVAKHPSHLRAPLIVRKFSTLQMLVQRGPEAFPGGRYYLPTRDDEFRFSNDDMVLWANARGITAKMLEGYHNQPLLHPRATVAQISDLLNA